MTDDTFIKTVQDQAGITDDASRQAGTPVAGQISDEHKNFAQTITSMIDQGTLDVADTQSFLKQEVYEGLDDEWKDKTDLALVNIANQVRLIYDFYKDDSFTNDSPQLQTMIEQLWQMKQSIEEHHDVFVF